ncbi:MAG: GxxExxY protein [Sarcina sp.]
MRKAFNTTGVCNPKKHYLVNISKKLSEIEELIENEFYFVITRPRQYGKTTTLSQLYKNIKNKYNVVKISFEGVGNSNFESEETFCGMITEMFKKHFKKDVEILEKISSVKTMLELGYLISEITESDEMILIIDEADKASNNEVFIEFLGMLRALYLEREEELSTTFKSVILAGVYDIRNLKLKIRGDYEHRYNSPWNIAVKFDVDMSFNESEIFSMLEEYSSDNNLDMNIENLSNEIYKFTSGYPFLVSRVCQLVDEDIVANRSEIWTEYHIQRATKKLINEKNMLFDDLIKNLENNKELYKFIYNILVLNISQVYNINNPTIEIGTMFGYLVADSENNVIVSNQILKEVIYNYMISRTDTTEMNSYNFKSNFIKEDNSLDIERVLLKFQQFMKENYSSRDTEFLERQGVLLFLAFIKPIINGVGFDYKEVQISEERRLDIVISYNIYKYVIETKIWHGEIAHTKGLEQLRNYLDIEGLDRGYLLIFNFNKNKEYSKTEYVFEEKEIFEVCV